jgi:hypothetical protein
MLSKSFIAQTALLSFPMGIVTSPNPSLSGPTASSNFLVPQDLRLNFTHRGPGCNMGNLQAALGEWSFGATTDILLVPDQFSSSEGPGSECNVSLQYDYSGQWTFEVAAVEFYGLAELPTSNDTARLKTVLHTAEDKMEGGRTLAGPMEKTVFNLTAGLAPPATVSSPCGSTAKLHVNTTGVFGGKSGKMESGNYFDLRAQVIHMNWTAC